VSNPNWKKGSRAGTSLHKQLETYAEDDCMTKEQHDRWRASEAAPPESRAPRRERKTVIG
jgi:hypothetical protein